MSRRDPEDLAGGFLNTAWSCGGRADCGDDDGRPQGCLSDVVHWRYGQRGRDQVTARGARRRRAIASSSHVPRARGLAILLSKS
jgi:hypothetical protein